MPLLFRKILVPVDFSPASLHALNEAVKLATTMGSYVILFHVVEASTNPLEAVAAENYEGLLQVEQDRLSELLKRRTPHLCAEALVRIGRASSEISDTAKALGVDLIVIGAQGESALKSLPLGSTAERVVRSAKCPVLTVRS